ncbi:MAG: class I SAM-dependent DNA methyltransferase [Candidatus Kapabacteria bacterium]|nr:class I SAM-dependent DNA methyltransferase [Candidatus Kapabacteria bacterium]
MNTAYKPLSWNEITQRAIAFTREWQNETSEDAEAKSFWDAFFNVFGVSRRRVASFEQPVKKDDGKQGYIDLLWKGVILVEHKSRGKDLNRAFSQALEYFPGLKDTQLPKYVLVSDFARFRLYDLDAYALGAGDNAEHFHEFPIEEFPQNVHHFGFLAGYEKRSFSSEDPVNIEAAARMGKLHDRLRDCGFAGHDLEMLLVRLLFCMFAEDTAIFEKNAFLEFIENRTSEDGSDLGLHLSNIFQVLNTAPEKRMKTLDEQLQALPYVNGGLFRDHIQIAQFDRTMRETLLECCALDWSRISPAIFGSMFQAAMNPTERRALGAHYTSETNILKALKPLFLDDLRAEFDRIKKQRPKLEEFHRRLASVRVFDPACGCGNFLVTAYRELRALELDVLTTLDALRGTGQLATDVAAMTWVNVGQFYGIELEEFPARIAEVALWLADHQMNLRASRQFGSYFTRLPLTESAHILHGNALRTDWREVCPHPTLSQRERASEMASEAASRLPSPSGRGSLTQSVERGEGSLYIVGNPPFVGAKYMNDAQRSDMATITLNVKNAGLLDFVTGWYLKASEYIAGTSIKAAFVSTNSISQGEQVGVLWAELFARKMSIHFAHRTFKWTNEAPGKAAVHCVIIGFAGFEAEKKELFSYQDIGGEPISTTVPNISPYLIPAGNTLVQSRSTPLCNVPQMGIGNKPIDGGNYLFTDEQKAEFLAQEPAAEAFMRPWIGADEFLYNYQRWVLWLGDCPPEVLRKMPKALERVEAVRKFRLASVSAPTRKIAATPTRFHVENMPQSTYLVIPEVSSERRTYIPVGFMQPEVICSNLVKLVPNATLYHFGVLSSLLHITWVKYVCGRLKSDYRYSNTIVYNNFPWAENPGEAQKQAVEGAAEAVLAARALFPTSSLADLYDPLTMPPALTKAHGDLDRAVEKCYRAGKGFASDEERITFLFALYERYTAPLTAEVERVAGGKKGSKNKQDS